ncbi:hypothetical protein LXD69_12355 [Flavobacterium sediminilitoris]|uniref:Uncharacterized protein n=2 Tax=Flavobacterium TaxID=237 RepID=A0ABY4HJT9_9FLAO|nr:MULTISPECIES: hypothetical protein [Flavobacterium]UOX32828.1 hypothetical protein LXD69_12355 [Flavobacterium sediminilitoris]
MNKLVKLNSITSIMIPLLAILLLIAPCSVRNHIETTLGVENTKPLNKNKATIPQTSNCTSWENAVQKSGIEISKKEIKKDFILKSYNYFHSYSFNFLTNTFFLNSNRNSKISIPFYILYKRLKYMILTTNITV